MIVGAPPRADKATVNSRKFLDRALGRYAGQDFAIRLWDGSIWRGPSDRHSPARFTLVLKHPAALRSMFLPPSECRLAEAYIRDDYDIEGDIERAIPLGHYLLNSAVSSADLLRLGWQLLMIPADRRLPAGRAAAQLRGKRHSLTRDRQAIAYHYSVSNQFYALWLDRRMIYSCAYFSCPEEDLDVAQTRKLDYICKKLRLSRGETLLDIGCGWGGLVIHAARHYGVKAHGITISEAQAEFANRRIRELGGPADGCRVEVADYREVVAHEGYDKIVSVGMFEHVGAELLSTYFTQAHRLLKPGGVFLNHAIALRPGESTTLGRFADRYVFPDGQLVPIGTALQAAEGSGFHVRDVESLREHYALTFRQWLRRLQANAHEARQSTGEITYRVWRLSLASLVYWFEQGRFDVYQTLLSKPDNGASRLPLTRADWYV